MPESKQKVKLPKSNVVGKTPNVNIMDFGELYVNYASGTGNSFLVTKKLDGTLAKFPESASVVSALNTKVDKVSGKGLSTNDFTTTLKNKLDGIAAGAEVNVQSDWSVTDTTSDAYIKSKPTSLSDFTNDLGEATTATTGLMSAADKTKLDGIASGAEVNIQADWAETNIGSDAYILNKPSIQELYTVEFELRQNPNADPDDNDIYNTIIVSSNTSSTEILQLINDGFEIKGRARVIDEQEQDTLILDMEMISSTPPDLVFNGGYILPGFGGTYIMVIWIDSESRWVCTNGTPILDVYYNDNTTPEEYSMFPGISHSLTIINRLEFLGDVNLNNPTSGDVLTFQVSQYGVPYWTNKKSASTTKNWYENNYESPEFINGRTHYVTFTNDILDVSSAIQPMVITQEMSGCCMFNGNFIASAYNSTGAIETLLHEDNLEILFNSIDTLMINNHLVFSGGHNISYLDVEIDEGCYQRLALIGNPQLYYNKLQSLFGGLNGHPIDNGENFAFSRYLGDSFIFTSTEDYGLSPNTTPIVVLQMKLICGVKQIPDMFINTASIDNEIPYIRYIGLEGNSSGNQWMDAGTGGSITIRAGDNIGVVGVGDNKLIISASSPTTYTEVTYSELLTLKQNSGLTPGAYYRMTDYKTMAKDGTVANITNPGGVNVIANDKQFDLLLLATSTTSIASEAKAVLHAGDTYFSACNMSSWQIWYDMGDDLTKVPYTYKHLLPTGHKGYIYRMIDEFNNDAFYDFKCLKFMLGQVMNKYTDIADFATSYFYTFDANGVEATVYYKGDQTYSSLTYIENNTIKLMTSDGNSNRWTTRCVFLVMRNMLGNIMIYDNKIYLSNTNACTFGASISKNTIKYSSVASEDMFINNTIENCYSLVCSGNVTNNNIKLTHQSNTTNQFGSRVNRNNICGQSKIVLENDIADNTFYNSTIDASGVSYVRYCEFNNVPNSNITFNNVGSGASNNWLQFINIRPNALNLEALPRLTSNELTRNLTETRIIEKNSIGVIKAFSLADLIQ